MIIGCTLAGIGLFVAHTAIKAILDVFVGIAYIVHLILGGIGLVWSFIFYILNGIGNFVLWVVTGILGVVGLIEFNIPVLNVIIFTFFSWIWWIIGFIIGGISIIYSGIFLIILLIGSVLIGADTIIGGFLTISSLGMRSVIAPFSIFSYLLNLYGIINGLVSTVQTEVFQWILFALECSTGGLQMSPVGIFAGFGPPALWGFSGIVKVIFSFYAAFFKIVDLFAGVVTGGILYVISVPLDLILSAFVLIGGGFIIGCAGTI